MRIGVGMGIGTGMLGIWAWVFSPEIQQRPPLMGVVLLQNHPQGIMK